MASTATVILTGVVYLSHLPQAAPPVVKVAITQSDKDMVSTRGGVIPRHRPFISVLTDDVDKTVKGSRRADLEVVAPGKAPRSIYFVRNETISIAGHSDTALTVPTTVADPAVPLTQVLKLSELCPTCRPFQQADFDKPRKEEVGGRLDITAGTVVAQALSECKAWHFEAEPGYDPHTKNVVPRQVAVKLSVPKALALNLTSFVSSGQTSTIAFKSGRNVEVTIGSASLDDVLEVGTTHMADRIDHHFELFYHLLMRSNAARHPLPVADQTCAIEHRPGGVDCPPIQP